MKIEKRNALLTKKVDPRGECARHGDLLVENAAANAADHFVVGTGQVALELVQLVAEFLLSFPLIQHNTNFDYFIKIGVRFCMCSPFLLGDVHVDGDVVVVVEHDNEERIASVALLHRRIHGHLFIIIQVDVYSCE